MNPHTLSTANADALREAIDLPLASTLALFVSALKRQNQDVVELAATDLVNTWTAEEVSRMAAALAEHRAYYSIEFATTAEGNTIAVPTAPHIPPPTAAVDGGGEAE